MSLQDTISQLQAAVADLVQQLPQGQTFSQSDVDAAVKAAVDPLNALISSLQDQISKSADGIAQAVAAEDVRIQGLIGPLLDQLKLALNPQPLPPGAPPAPAAS